MGAPLKLRLGGGVCLDYAAGQNLTENGVPDIKPQSKTKNPAQAELERGTH